MNHLWGQNLPPGAVNASRDRTNGGWASHHQYPTYQSPAPNNSYDNQQQHSSTSTLSNSVWNIPGSSSHNWHSSEPVTEEDPDGLPYEPDEEDPELTRKRKELQVIQEQIMLKRASLALKTVDVKTSRPGLCTEGSKSIESTETLRDRVKHILRLRDRVLRTNGPVSASRRSSFHIQHNHPLRRRIAIALQQRFVSLPVEPQECEPIPFLSSPSPRPKDPSPVKEEVNKGDQGFMRFLNILNKGVDIDKLTEIVNDDTGGLPHSSQNGVESPSKSPPIERKRLEEEQQRPSTGEQQKHLQNILESLGLSLGSDEINRLGDRTQERLYGKKQNTEEEKSQTEQQQQGEEKYSPAHYTRSSSSCESSSSSRSPSRTPSPFRRRRSPSPARSRRRSSWSPRRSRHSLSPYRRRNSRSPHRHKSPHPRDHQDSHLRYISPMQPYPYMPSQYFSPHFPPQMYPNAYCYSQYTAYYNYWVYNQASVAGPVESTNLNSPQNIPSLLPGLQSQHKSKEKKKKTFNEMNDKTRCLVAINQVSMSDTRKTMSTHERAQMNKRNKAQQKQRYWTLRASEKVENEQDKVKDWRTEVSAVIAAIRTEKDPTGGETTGENVDQGPSGTQQNPTNTAGPRKRRKKKKKKKLYFIERNEEMEKLLDNRPGPVTRALGLKNPEKLSESEQKLVEIKDVEAPLQDFWDDIPLNVPVEMTDTEEAAGVAEEKKPELTEEEIKANLKKVLQAFNSRMKKNVTQPAGLLMPQNIKVEDEI